MTPHQMLSILSVSFVAQSILIGLMVRKAWRKTARA